MATAKRKTTKAALPPAPVRVPTEAEIAARAAIQASRDEVKARYRTAVEKPAIDVQMQLHQLRQSFESAHKRPWIVPSWQRGLAWSDDQVIALHRRILGEGGTIGPIVVWIRYTAGRGYDTVVLDGQQRLSALGLPMVRELPDGSRVPVERAVPVWDTVATGWGWEPGPTRYPLAALLSPSMRDGALWDARGEGPDAEARYTGAIMAISALAEVDLHSVVIAAHWGARQGDPDVQRKAAMRAFLEMNTGGTPISMAEIAELRKLCDL